MIQTLTLSSTNTGDYFLSSDGLQLYHRKRDPINLNMYDDCFGCVFYIPSNRQSCCFKCEKLPDVECLAQSNFQRVDVYYSFMILYENLESVGLKMYTSLNEIQNMLSEDIQSLFISAYNTLLTKDILEILKKPLNKGYELELSVRNDELMIKYTWKQN